MPLVGALAAWRAHTAGRAVRASLLSLALLAAAFPLVAIGEGGGAWLLRQAGFALAVFAFHAPFAAAYAWGSAWALGGWWPRRPLAARPAG